MQVIVTLTVAVAELKRLHLEKVEFGDWGQWLSTYCEGLVL